MNKNLVLDIAMNLNRIGNWITEDYSNKKNRIDSFLEQNKRYIKELNLQGLSEQSILTFKRFLNEYPKLEKSIKTGSKSNLNLAERMMTWGNILTHKASLILN